MNEALWQCRLAEGERGGVGRWQFGGAEGERGGAMAVKKRVRGVVAVGVRSVECGSGCGGA